MRLGGGKGRKKGQNCNNINNKNKLIQLKRNKGSVCLQSTMRTIRKDDHLCSRQRALHSFDCYFIRSFKWQPVLP